MLTGVRPEEVGDWRAGSLQPVSELTLTAAADAQGQAVERAVETGRRVAARGGHAVVLIDTLEYVPAAVARRALAAARNIVDGGSLTIIATAREPLGGETTVIALDAELAGSGRIPGARPDRQRHDPPRAARRREGCRGDRRRRARRRLA